MTRLDNQDFILKRNKNNTYLLHSRLSIIDLNKKSNQPFYEKDNILSFNGEIYNYIELAKDKSILIIFTKLVILKYYLIYFKKE